MTGRILKLDPQDEPPTPPRRGRPLRWLVLVFALAALFAGVALSMLVALPKPHTDSDYMIAGGLATMATMLALAVVVLSTRVRSPDLFFKRRRK